MSIANGPPPILLTATAQAPSLAGALGRGRYAVLEARCGTVALAWARDIQPDLIVLEADLTDMSGIEACRLLRSDPRIGPNVPVLILVPAQPTPDQRVAALRAGAWDFLRYPYRRDELALKLQAYVQAKRNIDIALAEGLVNPTTGLHTRQGLARRVRELGALMSRKHGALACLVFVLETEVRDSGVGAALIRNARLSDVVGTLAPNELAVLAPATAHAGAVRLAVRASGTIRDVLGEDAARARGADLVVGYDAVANLGYAPIDPVDLLGRAAAAVRDGTPEPGSPWLRRFCTGGSATEPGTRPARVTPPGRPTASRSDP